MNTYTTCTTCARILTELLVKNNGTRYWKIHKTPYQITIRGGSRTTVGVLGGAKVPARCRTCAEARIVEMNAADRARWAIGRGARATLQG